ATLILGWATAADEGTVDQLEAAFLETVDSLANDPPTADEMVRARATVEREELDGLQRVGDRADRLSMYATLFDDPGMMNRRLPALLDVSAQRASEATGATLTADNRVVLRFVPSDEPAAPQQAPANDAAGANDIAGAADASGANDATAGEA
ncbi:MAG: peptidase M16, partial [Actinomycetota bacterium]